jgi:RNA polymerase sigma factor (sigma-70 family)
MGMRIRGGGAARELQALFDAGAIGSLGDGDLLARFLGRDDSAEPAFAALVDRHERMVLRVCLDVLGDPHEAQDAAQATFFILARKAAAIRKPEALPSWLHGTARRVASRALRESIRRRKHERRSAEVSTRNGSEESPRGWPELHEELARLPDRYREPIVLCDLTGLTHEQAAGKLGCPARTLETRLYRGRERLKDRLVRRGLAPSAALVGATWATESQAALPSGWTASTASAAVRLAKGSWATVGEVPANAVRWARNHLKETAMFKLKLILGSSLLLGLAWQQVRSQTPPPPAPAKAQASTKAEKMTPQPAPDPSLPGIYTHPITVTGRAFDPEGKPVAGARIVLTSRRADYKRVAEGKTDLEGRYVFRDVPLPIERANTVNGADHGTLQVYGEADGLGFAFRQRKDYYPARNPQGQFRPARIAPGRTAPSRNPQERVVGQFLDDQPDYFEGLDPIVLDLNFPRAARLGGTVVDDRGNPLPNIGLEVRDCEVGVRLDDNRLWDFDSFGERHSRPASMKLRTTDALGRFEFTGLPVDCRFRIMVGGKGFPSSSILAATASKSERYLYGEAVQTGELKVVVPIPMDVPIKMVYADTRKPAAKVLVHAGGNAETSDDQGLATLRLSRGNYRMSNWPARGTPYLVTEERLEVGEKPPAGPIVFTLRRAAELDVYVFDDSIGRGLAMVDLWHEAEGHREKYVMKSWEVATRIARRDSPRTDANGKLRVFVEPGKHRFGVGLEAYPKGYEAVNVKGLEVECRAGETSTLKFAMRPRR